MRRFPPNWDHLAPTITQVRLKQHPHRYHFSLKDSLTRRQFLAIVGAGAGVATLALPGRVLASDCSLPNPIPGTLDGSPFHIKLPGYPPLGSPDPASNDAATITDFNGHVGLAYVRGMGTRIDKSTSQTQRLPFEVDLRFMKGEYLGADGRYHHGAFTLV